MDCLTNAYCGRGLADVYGVDISADLTTSPRIAESVDALRRGVVDVAFAFSNSPYPQDPDLVALEDDLEMIGADNVVPVYRRTLRELFGEHRAKADVQDSEGNTVVSVRGALMPIPKRVTITGAAGEQVAELKAKAFSPIKTRMALTMTDGTQWQLEGELLEKNYTVTADGAPVIAISQKWMKVRDSYTLDVADGTSAALALALLWTVDRWVEQD